MKGIQLRPGEDGLRAALYDLEADIMEAVWSSGWRQFAVADVHRVLSRGRDIAYTTVMTTLARLCEKGLLERERIGKRHIYRARMDRDGFIEEVAREVFDSLPELKPEHAVALLADRVKDADVEALDRLEALIRRRREELA